MDLLALNAPLLLPLLLLALAGCSSGSDVLPKGPVDAVLGKNVTLQTLLDKPEFAFLIWNFNDGREQTHVITLSATGPPVVNAPYVGRVSVDEANGYLTLSGLKPADSGDYSITIISKTGATQTAEIKLRVLTPVSNVVIKSDLSEAIEHNSTVVLTCSAQGSLLTFTWTNGTAPIVADSKRVTIKDAETSSTLTYAGVLRYDLVGPIFCSVTNKLETEKSAPFNLTVYYGPDQASISPANPPPVVRAGSDFNLSCSAASSPPATFSWYRGAKALEASGPVLTLKAIEALGLGAEAAEFTCRAKNAKTGKLVPSGAVSFAVMEAISGAAVTGPTTTLVAGNSTANLTCQAKAGTVKTRTWLKDGTLLSAGGRVAFADDMSSVRIDPLQKEDNGEYACRLANPVNTDEAVYKMVVNHGPEPVTVTGEDAVEINEPVTLKCSSSSVPPANFTWKFNGTATGVRTAQYAIPAAVYKNTGMYTCEAHNAVTGKTATHTHYLSVKEEGALDEGLSDGAIAGIIIAILVALGAAIGLIIYCRQKVPVESPY